MSQVRLSPSECICDAANATVTTTVTMTATMTKPHGNLTAGYISIQGVFEMMGHGKILSVRSSLEVKVDLKPQKSMGGAGWTI